MGTIRTATGKEFSSNYADDIGGDMRALLYIDLYDCSMLEAVSVFGLPEETETIRYDSDEDAIHRTFEGFKTLEDVRRDSFKNCITVTLERRATVAAEQEEQ